MLRRTTTTLRVSPYSLFLKDLAKTKELSGMPLQEGAKVASRMYRGLRPEELQALQKRASKARYPALDAFNRFQRQQAFRFTHLNNIQRQRIIARMWHDMQKKQTDLRELKAAKKLRLKKSTDKKQKKTKSTRVSTTMKRKKVTLKRKAPKRK
ncbi:kinetoplast DNA-associated protein [Trypanosoma grayi]|uniref:kinetoplast DNA-associated protein n=1 Tax=Trypanosoma grayi TaxID=71804 RepID=UPI0004F4A64A|nr:kinetoplast DNA-associated protein [Trypanosoma grayi]KEG15589.1 kinetoplast DNA-associated protein [Trypanosoma grayi]